VQFVGVGEAGPIPVDYRTTPCGHAGLPVPQAHEVGAATTHAGRSCRLAQRLLQAMRLSEARKLAPDNDVPGYVLEARAVNVPSADRRRARAGISIPGAGSRTTSS